LAEKTIEFSKETIEGLYLALQNARIQALLTVFIVVILTIFSNIIVSRNLTRPLKKILKGTDEVAKGNLNFEIGVETKDELGELSTHFNKMTKQLKETKTALEGSKATLEMRVQARTRELKKAAVDLDDAKTTLEIKVKARTRELEGLTKGLDEQVKQRTKEIQGKINELEVFQRLAIGRELKMVELKKEIGELRKENERLKK